MVTEEEGQGNARMRVALALASACSCSCWAYRDTSLGLAWVHACQYNSLKRPNTICWVSYVFLDKVEWDSLSWKQSWFFACFCVAYVSDVKIRNTVVRDRYVVVDTSIVGRWYHNRSRSSWMILTISFIHHELWRTNTQHTIPAFHILSLRSKWHTWVYYSPELFAFCINPPQN